MSKAIPIFKTDEEAEKFIDTADLSEYDLSDFKPTRFEFEAKDTQINMRLPESLLRAVRATSKERRPEPRPLLGRFVLPLPPQRILQPHRRRARL
jgi:CopG antitoxin of type II toxin-antitoxin system